MTDLVTFVSAIVFSEGLRSVPSGLAVDAHGALYVVDRLQDQIRVFDLTGSPLAT